jgi:hypothetical protein
MLVVQQDELEHDGGKECDPVKRLCKHVGQVHFVQNDPVAKNYLLSCISECVLGPSFKMKGLNILQDEVMKK